LAVAVTYALSGYHLDALILAVLRAMDNGEHYDIPAIFVDFIDDDVGILNEFACAGSS
jgi:hypothetical protein